MAIENEQQAEEALLAAVLSPDVQQLDEASRIDVDEPEEEAEADEVEAEAEGEEEQPEKAAEPADPEDDFVEIELDGGAKEKLPVKDLVQGFKAYKQVENRVHEVIDRVRDDAVSQARAQYQQVQQYSEQVGATLTAALQLLQLPQAPDTALLDPSSPNYNPDRYHMMRAQFEKAQAQHGQARQLGAHLLQEAKRAEDQAKFELESRELERLKRAWPEFGEPETTNKFVQDMQKAYGITAEELDAILVDHRQALVARDALAYRQMKAKSAPVQKAVEAKAPKLVRSRTESKAPLRQRGADGKFLTESRARLAKEGTDEAAAAYFAGLIKSGRL